MDCGGADFPVDVPNDMLSVNVHDCSCLQPQFLSSDCRRSQCDRGSVLSV